MPSSSRLPAVRTRIAGVPQVSGFRRFAYQPSNPALPRSCPILPDSLVEMPWSHWVGDGTEVT